MTRDDASLIVGKKSILDHLRLASWPAVMRLVAEGLPVRKVGGRWVTRADLLDQWVQRRLSDW